MANSDETVDRLADITDNLRKDINELRVVLEKTTTELDNVHGMLNRIDQTQQEQSKIISDLKDRTPDNLAERLRRLEHRSLGLPEHEDLDSLENSLKNEFLSKYDDDEELINRKDLRFYGGLMFMTMVLTATAMWTLFEFIVPLVTN